MLTKRTKQEILDDFKKIDGRVSITSLLRKGSPLLNEWIEKGYDSNLIFRFGDNFSCSSPYGADFPKEINIAYWSIMMDSLKKDLPTLKTEGLDPLARFSGGCTLLMQIAKTPRDFQLGNLREYLEKGIALGVDKNAIDDSGKTALDHLRAAPHKETPELKELLKDFLTGQEVLAARNSKSPDTLVEEASAEHRDGRGLAQE